MNENLNYASYTRLPTKTFLKADKANPVIEVLTPHKGVVFVEIKTVDKGMFRPATEIDKPTQVVLKELYDLEREAKNYLLTQWLTSPLA